MTYNVKKIIIFICFVFNIFFLPIPVLADFQNFAGSIDNNMQSSGESSFEFIDSSNWNTSTQEIGASGNIGVKADCTGIELQMDVAGFISDIKDEIGGMLEQYAYIKAINTIIHSLAYSWAIGTCLSETGQTLAAAPTAAALVADITASVQDDLADAFSSGTKNVGGSASFTEKNTSIKPTKVADAMTKAQTKIQQQYGDEFLNCINEKIPAYEEKIISILNGSLFIDFEKMFNARQECMIGREQAEYDLLEMTKKYLPDIKQLIFPDGTAVDAKTGKVEKTSKRISNPTVEEDKKILLESNRVAKQTIVAREYDPLITQIVFEYIKYTENNNATVSQSHFVEFYINNVCTKFPEIVAIYKQNLDRLRYYNILTEPVVTSAKARLSSILSDINSLFENIGLNIDLATFTKDIQDAYNNRGLYAELVHKAVTLYISKKYNLNITEDYDYITEAMLKDAFNPDNSKDFQRYLAASYVFNLASRYNSLNMIFNEQIIDISKTITTNYLANRLIFESDKLAISIDPNLLLTKASRKATENSLLLVNKSIEEEYRGLFKAVEMLCRIDI